MLQVRRKILIRISAGVLCLLAFSLYSCVSGSQGTSTAKKDSHPTRAYPFVAFGDAPYQEAEKQKAGKLTQLAKSTLPRFAVHVGDIKQGSSTCSDDKYQWAIDWFKAFPFPVFYTPGDNEWTDCHRSKTAPNDPKERLAHIRKTFFAQPKAFGSGADHFKVRTQSNDENFSEYKENLMWSEDGIVFLTLHIVGSNNNRNPKNKWAYYEYADRVLATLVWINKAFVEVNLQKARAIVLIFHADMEFPKANDRSKGFTRIVDKILQKAEIKKIPILLVHGDSHHYKFDQPFKNYQFGVRKHKLDHVYRVIVPGSPEFGLAKITIQPETNPPFVSEKILVQ